MLTIAEALQELSVREGERDEYRRFYRGDQGVHLRTPEMRIALRGRHGFALNFCKTIVESLTDRVQVKAVNASVVIDGVDDVAQREAAEKEASANATDAVRAIWERSALDVSALSWRYSVDADAWVGLEIDEDGARLRRLDSSRVVPLSETETFVRTGERSGTVYAGATRTNFALGDDGEWRPVTTTGYDDAGNALEAIDTSTVVDADGNPLPTLIERIRNGDDDTSWGMSDLAAAVPQQRAINQRAIDIHQVSGTAAWPQRFLVGPNAAKSAVRLLSSPGAIHGINSSAEGATSLHEFSAADPTKLASTLDDLVEYLSITTGTPLSTNGTGANSSGEARRIAQDKLTRRVGKATEAIGVALSRLLESALRLAGITADVLIEWESAEPIATKDLLETAQMKIALGVSKHTVLSELGYDPDREEMLRARERAEDQVALTRALSVGADTPDDLGDLLGPAGGA